MIGRSMISSFRNETQSEKENRQKEVMESMRQVRTIQAKNESQRLRAENDFQNFQEYKIHIESYLLETFCDSVANIMLGMLHMDKAPKIRVRIMGERIFCPLYGGTVASPSVYYLVPSLEEILNRDE